MPRSRYSTIQNSLFGSRTLSHVNNSDTVRASITKIADLGQTSGEHARENGFLLEKLQKDAAKFGISVKHELYERRSWYFQRSNRQQCWPFLQMKKKKLFFPPIFFVSTKIASERNKSLPVNSRII